MAGALASWTNPGHDPFSDMPPLVDSRAGGGGGGVIPPPPGATRHDTGEGLSFGAFPGHQEGRERAYRTRRGSRSSMPQSPNVHPPPTPTTGWAGPGPDHVLQLQQQAAMQHNYSLNAFPNFPSGAHTPGVGGFGTPHTPYLPTPFMGAFPGYPPYGGYGGPHGNAPALGGYGGSAGPGSGGHGGNGYGNGPHTPGAWSGLPGFNGSGGPGGEGGLFANHREYDREHGHGHGRQHGGRGGDGWDADPYENFNGGGGGGGIEDSNWFARAMGRSRSRERGHGHQREKGRSKSKRGHYGDDDDEEDDPYGLWLDHGGGGHGYEYPEHDHRYREEARMQMPREQMEEMERRKREQYLMERMRKDNEEEARYRNGGAGDGYDFDALDRGFGLGHGDQGHGNPYPHDEHERGRSRNRTKDGKRHHKQRSGEILDDLGLHALSLDDFAHEDEDLEYERLQREQRKKKKDKKRSKMRTEDMVRRANSRGEGGVRLGYRDPREMQEYEQARIARALAYQRQMEAELNHARYPRPVSWRSDYSVRAGILSRVRRHPSEVQEIPADPVKKILHTFLQYIGEEASEPAISMDLRMSPRDTAGSGAAARVNRVLTYNKSERPLLTPSKVMGVYFLSIPRLQRNVTQMDLIHPACHPPAGFMRCYHPRLPWYVDIYSQVQPGGPVLVLDVLDQLWRSLQQQVGEMEYWTEEMDDDPREVEREVRRKSRSRVREAHDEQYGVGRRFVGKAWRERCVLVGLANGDEPLSPEHRAKGLTGMREKEEMNRGVKRVDWLGAEGKLRFVGLTRRKDGIWEIKTEKV